MPKARKTDPPSMPAGTAGQLKGWKEIAAFLGQPISVAQRWAKTGMPVSKQKRSVTATAEHLTRWLGRESGEPVHVAADTADLLAELKRGLSYVRQEPAKHK